MLSELCYGSYSHKGVFLMETLVDIVAIMFGMYLGLAAGGPRPLALAMPTWVLWNWLMPEVLGLREINFFQALGLNILCCILFQNCSGGWSSKD